MQPTRVLVAVACIAVACIAVARIGPPIHEQSSIVPGVALTPAETNLFLADWK